MTFVILLELPDIIKKELLRLNAGLPSAEWQTEENFYVNLHRFKKLTDVERWDIIDLLGEIQAAPFLLKIHRLNYSPMRKNAGILWASLEPSSELEMLKKNIHNLLRPFNHHNHENNHQNYPAIQLGTVQKESPERIALYFEANGEFVSSTFEVKDFVLAQLHQTPKRSFYTIEKRYLLG